MAAKAPMVVDIKLVIFISVKVEFNRVILAVCSHHVEKRKDTTTLSFEDFGSEGDVKVISSTFPKGMVQGLR